MLSCNSFCSYHEECWKPQYEVLIVQYAVSEVARLTVTRIYLGTKEKGEKVCSPCHGFARIMGINTKTYSPGLGHSIRSHHPYLYAMGNILIKAINRMPRLFLGLLPSQKAILRFIV